MNFISCVKWVKQGVAKHEPDYVHLNETEIKTLLEEVDKEVVDEDADEPDSPTTSNDDEYNMKNYDADDDFRVSLKGIADYDKTQNPKQKSKPRKMKYDDDADNSDKEDEVIKEDDNLILVGHVDGDFNSLEVYVYNETDGDMYIHHDLIMKSPPLCVDWLTIPTESGAGNVCAVGGMDPIIEIWDLDIVNSVEPVVKLGRNKKKNPHKNNGHTDAVLSIAWNTELQHILCSGSVDTKALLWDLDSGQVSTELSSFTDKVQALAWNASNPYFLLTGCADGYVRNFDCRVFDQFEKRNCRSGVETILWDATNEHVCYVGTEEGTMYCIDWRTKKPLWRQKEAHNKEVTGLNLYGKDDSKLLVSISTDECMKLWDVSSGIRSICTKDLKLQSLHCTDMNPNYSNVICVGGSSESRDKQLLKVVNIDDILRPKQSNDSGSGNRTDASSSRHLDVPLSSITAESSDPQHFHVPLLEDESIKKKEVTVRPHKKKLRKKLLAEKMMKVKKQERKFEKLKKKKRKTNVNA